MTDPEEQGTDQVYVQVDGAVYRVLDHGYAELKQALADALKKKTTLTLDVHPMIPGAGGGLEEASAMTAALFIAGGAVGAVAVSDTPWHGTHPGSFKNQQVTSMAPTARVVFEFGGPGGPTETHPGSFGDDGSKTRH